MLKYSSTPTQPYTALLAYLNALCGHLLLIKHILLIKSIKYQQSLTASLLSSLTSFTSFRPCSCTFSHSSSGTYLPLPLSPKPAASTRENIFSSCFISSSLWTLPALQPPVCFIAGEPLVLLLPVLRLVLLAAVVLRFALATPDTYIQLYDSQLKLNSDDTTCEIPRPS